MIWFNSILGLFNLRQNYYPTRNHSCCCCCVSITIARTHRSRNPSPARRWKKSKKLFRALQLAHVGQQLMTLHTDRLSRERLFTLPTYWPQSKLYRLVLGHPALKLFSVTYFNLFMLWWNSLINYPGWITFFKKWDNRGLFFIYFRLFKHTLQFLQQINVKKCPFTMRDSNSRTLAHESPPLTTRPWLPPLNYILTIALLVIKMFWLASWLNPGARYRMDIFLHLFVVRIVCLFEKMKINKKRPWLAHFFKKRKKERKYTFESNTTTFMIIIWTPSFRKIDLTSSVTEIII